MFSFKLMPIPPVFIPETTAKLVSEFSGSLSERRIGWRTNSVASWNGVA